MTKRQFQHILEVLLRLINQVSKYLIINNKIKDFNKKIIVDGDKSLSIRWVLLASQATGISRAYNLLKSEDVIAALESIKKLGIKVKKHQKPGNNEPGGIVEKEMPIHISNLNFFDSKSNKGVRLGFKFNKDEKN